MKQGPFVLAAAGLMVAHTASSAMLWLDATIDSQSLPWGTQVISGNRYLTGHIDLDMVTGVISAFSLTTAGSYTITSSLGPVVTFAPNSTWSIVSPVNVSMLLENGTGLTVVYNWGIDAPDSNAASSYSGASPTCVDSPYCSFAMTGSPAWDRATLSIDLDSALIVTGARLVTIEISNVGNTVSYYTFFTPTPAAAWLFGSGLLGLAATLRRRGTA